MTLAILFHDSSYKSTVVPFGSNLNGPCSTQNPATKTCHVWNKSAKGVKHTHTHQVQYCCFQDPRLTTMPLFCFANEKWVGAECTQWNVGVGVTCIRGWASLRFDEPKKETSFVLVSQRHQTSVLFEVQVTVQTGHVCYFKVRRTQCLTHRGKSNCCNQQRLKSEVHVSH